MTTRILLCAAALLLSACSAESDLPNDVGDAERAMAAEAQTLEEAAASAAAIVEKDAAAETAAALEQTQPPASDPEN